MLTMWARMIPIWAYVALAALLVIGVQQWRVHHYKAQATALQGVANTLHDANQSNLATIVALQAANRQWADKCTANQTEARQQAQLSVTGDAKRQTSAHKTIQALQATYEHEPDVKAWADTRVPDIAVRSLYQAGGTH